VCLRLRPGLGSRAKDRFIEKLKKKWALFEIKKKVGPV
jgi:hypothetical protein